ncbi:La-related protein 6C [Raphanus sativus]|nr:La-related protein 6C [Raphanus sativus]
MEKRTDRRNFDGILVDDETRYESKEDSPRLHLTEQQQLNLHKTVRKHHFLACTLRTPGKRRGSYAVGGGGRNFRITATKGPRMLDGTRGFTMGRGNWQTFNLTLTYQSRVLKLHN